MTVFWDTWLAQKVGKAKAKWESKRRRARDEAGDVEDTTASQVIQPAQELQIQRPEAVKRRAQGGTSTDRIVADEAASEPGRTDSQRSTESGPNASTPVADVKSHRISIKVGVPLIVGFFGKWTLLIIGDTTNQAQLLSLLSWSFAVLLIVGH